MTTMALLIIIVLLVVSHFCVLWYARSMVSQRDDALDKYEAAQADADKHHREYQNFIAEVEAHPLVSRRMKQMKEQVDA